VLQGLNVLLLLDLQGCDLLLLLSLQHLDFVLLRLLDFPVPSGLFSEQKDLHAQGLDLNAFPLANLASTTFCQLLDFANQLDLELLLPAVAALPTKS
jgi:hypothetical protein